MICFLNVEVFMIDLREVRSVTDFQRNAKEYVGKLRKSRTPLVLTVNGRAELVVQDAGSYQDLLDRLDELEAVAAIRVGLEDMAKGKVQPARKALKDLGTKFGLHRRNS
jgi:PHD/YefM family antitoxin component YafN of YafNO toxin-antitoxin module